MIDIQKAYKEAKKFKSCKAFTGKEDYSNITDLMFSPQGIEFCTTYNVPSIEVFMDHKIRTSELEKKGLFINAGNIELKNVENIWIVGRTTAKIYIDNPKVKHQIVLMHGAKAEIYADNYAVVFLFGNGEVKKKVTNHAIIL